MAKLGEKLITKNNDIQNNNISVTFAYEEGQNQMNINSDNSMILQKQMVSLNYNLLITY